MKLNLPEKLYYSPEDIKEHWGIDDDTYKQYTNELKILRQAYKTQGYLSNKFLCLRIPDSMYAFLKEEYTKGKFSITNPSYEYYELPTLPPGTDEYHESAGIDYNDNNALYESHRITIQKLSSSYEFITFKEYLFSKEDTAEIPDFAYISDKGLEYGGETHYPFIENFEGEVFMLIRTNKINDIEDPISFNKLPIFFFEPNQYTYPEKNRPVITQVEKEKFEIQYSKKVDTECTQPESINGKSRNSYLRTIQALSFALIDGLTGSKDKDAKSVLAALDLKGVKAPIKEKALGHYLEEASKLVPPEEIKIEEEKNIPPKF